MQYSTVNVDQSEGIATVTLNRPDRFNALNRQLLDELPQALAQLARDESVRVVVLTGAGTAFCSGADLGWLGDNMEQWMGGEDTGISVDYASTTSFCLAIRNVPQPTVASINGLAVGGGITLALNCDIRIAAEEATMVFPFASMVGVTPEFASTYTLPRLVGIAKACELMFTGKSITGGEAKAIGLVNDAVPLEKLGETTSRLAKSIARASATATQLAKRGLYQGMNADLYSQLLWEEEALRETFGSEDNQEAISAFLEKRKPVFKGRR